MKTRADRGSTRTRQIEKAIAARTATARLWGLTLPESCRGLRYHSEPRLATLLMESVVLY